MSKFTDEEYRIAWNVAKRFAPPSYIDEAYSTAAHAILNARETFDESKSRKLTAYQWTMAKQAVVDDVRKYHGRTGHKRAEFNSKRIALEDYHADVVPAECNIKHFEEGFHNYEGFFKALTNIEVTVLAMIMDGTLKQDIATHLGVTPGRISQHLKNVRKKMECFNASLAMAV